MCRFFCIWYLPAVADKILSVVLVSACPFIVEEVVIGIEVDSFELVGFGTLVVVLPYFLVVRVDVIELVAA